MPRDAAAGQQKSVPQLASTCVVPGCEHFAHSVSAQSALPSPSSSMPLVHSARVFSPVRPALLPPVAPEPPVVPLPPTVPVPLPEPPSPPPTVPRLPPFESFEREQPVSASTTAHR